MNIINCTRIVKDLEQCLVGKFYSKVFVLTDEGSQKYCTSFLSKLPFDHQQVTIKAGDENKTVESLSKVWRFLSDNGADRESLLINLGGGMVTDLGGFAGSTFKRGISFINIPTTLLSMVDAAVGGKTGINFNGFKNEVGVINHADAVLIDTTFLKTLDEDNIFSGFGEIIKHGLISRSDHFIDALKFDWSRVDYAKLNQLVMDSISVKEQIVEQDPYEKGIRKALNLGHTMGHAFESLALKRDPMLHGRAVALGLVPELFLSHQKLGFPTEVLRQFITMVKDCYPSFAITCDDYDMLYDYMKHDKKNSGGRINFTLLSGIGEVQINQDCTKEEIFLALDFYRDEFGI